MACVILFPFIKLSVTNLFYINNNFNLFIPTIQSQHFFYLLYHCEGSYFNTNIKLHKNHKLERFHSGHTKNVIALSMATMILSYQNYTWNANIMKTQICHKMNYDLKDNWRSHKATYMLCRGWVICFRLSDKNITFTFVNVEKFSPCLSIVLFWYQIEYPIKDKRYTLC